MVLRHLNFFEKQIGSSVKIVHTDGGSELSEALEVFKERGVHVSVITTYTPESNELDERTHAPYSVLQRHVWHTRTFPFAIGSTL